MPEKSAIVRASSIPTLLPWLTGLMMTGSGTSVSCRRASVSWSQASKRGVSTPAPIACNLVATLSIAMADAREPDPTNGMRRSSSRRCNVPSSPNGPCRAGNTTSVG